jgi:hypothetical protein
LTGIVKLLVGKTNDSWVVVLAIGGTKCFGVGELTRDGLEAGSGTDLWTALYNGLLLGYLSDTRGGSDTLACLGQGVGAQGGDGRASSDKVVVLAEEGSVGLDGVLDSLDIAIFTD